MGLDGTELIEYACMRFQEQKYDEALEAFVLAYSRGIEQEWILENIYNCYISGNEEEFARIFGQFQKQTGIFYEQCVLDFIPYREGEYYIYDKKMRKFRGTFSIGEFENVSETERMLMEMEYSACALEMDWNWNDYKCILTEARNRKLYVVSHDIERMSSFFKIPELQTYAKNIVVFTDRKEFRDYFHENTSVYLPHAVAGSEQEKKNMLMILEEEHQYRLTPEGRNTDNVLLTIGIPTHARGNILLKRIAHLRNMMYDAEIEIAVSKNGMLLYEKEYAQVCDIADARINYYDHGKELKPEENWHYTVEMAHGKYVLLVADEDDVCLDALEHYLKLLSDFPEVAIVRAKGETFFADIDKQIIAKAGLDAFEKVFLRQNYLSGLIVRRDIFLEQNFLELKQFSDNEYYRRYPHDWWCTLMSLKSDYIEEPVQLFVEQDSVLEEERKAYEQMGLSKMEDVCDMDTHLSDYSTYEGRFLQLEGQAKFLHMMATDNSELVEVGLAAMVGKLAWLLEIARERHYKADTFIYVLDEFEKASMRIMNEFSLSANSRENMLRFIKYCVQHMQNCHACQCAKEESYPK